MALQEFLASYAVKVDEDGARRLQRILEQNRTAGAELAGVFSSARDALAALKKELSETAGLKNALEGLLSGSSRLPSGAARGAAAGAAASAAVPAGQVGRAGVSSLAFRADFAAADESLTAFRKRAEAEKPKLSVNTTGITSSVSSAMTTVRNMLASVRIDLPVTVTPHLDASALNREMSNLPNNWNVNLPSGNNGSSPSGNTSPGNSSPSANSGRDRSGNTISRLGIGGRVNQPTLAMIAEEGKPEYVIPTGNESRAVPLLQSLFSELSESARSTVFSSLVMGNDRKESGEAGSSSANLSSAPSAPTQSGNPEKMASTEMLRNAVPQNLSAATVPSTKEPEAPPATGRSFGFPPAAAAQHLAGSDLPFISALSDLRSALPSASALSELRSALMDLTSAAREAFRPSAAAGGAVQNVQAPVNIHVTSSAAAPEAVARSIYDTAQRSLLKTLKGVFV